MIRFTRLFFNLFIATVLLASTLTLSPPPTVAQGSAPPTIYLHSRTFVPAAGVDPSLSAAGAGVQALGEERMHVLLQFQEHPDAAQKAQLGANGIHLLTYLPDYAWYASVPLGVAAASQPPQGARWIGDIKPDDKIAPIFRANPPEAGKPLRLIILVHPDVGVATAAAAVKTLGGTVLDTTPEFQQMHVEMADGASLSALAASDLWYWIAPEPPPPQSYNEGSRAATKTNLAQAAGYHGNPGGAFGRIVVGIWDGGVVDPSHPAFAGRLTIAEPITVPVDGHATHVAGTVGGSGAGSPPGHDYRGHADQVQIISYDYYGNILTEAGQAINTYDIDISQNSWGTVGTCDPRMGDYTAESMAVDGIVTGVYPKRIAIAFSLGNYQQCPGGWNTLAPEAGAKNVIGVGATYSEDKGMTDYSSWGPTDDGRLKPDVVAPGSTKFKTPNNVNITSSLGYHGGVVGANGTVLLTAGGGREWRDQSSALGITETLMGGHGRPNDESISWIVGTGGIILYSDGWPLDSGTTNDLHDVYFASDTDGWVVGAGGVISGTTDGGVTWKAQASGTANDLWGVTAVNTQTAWAVGSGGTVINTTNGTTWMTQTSGTTNDLYGVFFANGNDGWAVGAGGTILGTSDGGTTWMTQTSGTTEDLNGVASVDTNNGWTVGNGGTILHTADGGATWSAQTSGTTQNLNAVFAANAQTAWAVGDGGTILHTTDGGTTWNAQTSGTTQNLNDVFFTYTSRYGGAPYSGTSMATPAVSGILALMLEAYNETYGADPWPSTLKAVLLHTAEDLGNAGPDYKFGYGHVDALAAVNTIKATTGTTTSVYIRQGSVSNGQTQIYTLSSNGISAPKCTLVWDDAPGTPASAKALVNDLDLRLIAPDGTTTYQPWVLDKDNQGNPATRGDNNLDPIEQVVATTAQAGTWTVRVIGDSVPQGPEEFSLVCPTTAEALSISKSDSPDPVAPGGVLSYTIVVASAAATSGAADDWAVPAWVSGRQTIPTIPAYSVRVTDTVPVSATCCASIGQGGTYVSAANMVVWTISPTLSSGLAGDWARPGQVSSRQTLPTFPVTLTFAVTVDKGAPAGTIITNADYGVMLSSTLGITVTMGRAVTTTVQVEKPGVYLPIIRKQ